jgi:hypothetical protein
VQQSPINVRLNGQRLQLQDLGSFLAIAKGVSKWDM